MREYFQLNDGMYHKDCIEWVKVDGGPWGFGCWGEIKLKHEKNPRTIGDGSYYGHKDHVKHTLAGWSFWRIKEIMRDILEENHTKKQHEALNILYEKKKERKAG